MRARTTGVLAVAALVSTVGGVVVVTDRGADHSGALPGRDASSVAVFAPTGPASALEALERRLDGVSGSRRQVGAFELTGGRALRLHSIETVGGDLCLIDDEDGVALGSVCLENGLLRQRVVFSINSSGGPGRFGELYLVGLASPDVASVVVRRTDGSTRSLTPGRRGAFLYETSADDLARDVVPSALELRGHAGRLLDTIEIPSVR